VSRKTLAGAGPRRYPIGMKLSLALLPLLAATAWSAEDPVCGNWKNRLEIMKRANAAQAAETRERRAGKEMLEFRKNFSRLKIVMELSALYNDPDTSEGDRAKIAAQMRLLDSPHESALRRTGEGLDEMQRRSRESAINRWKKIENAVEVPKAEFPAFVDHLLKLIEPPANAEMRELLLHDPKTAIPALIPGAEVSDCGESFVLSQRKAAATDQETAGSVKLGNVAEPMRDAVNSKP
jgi:hypothetical protein